jgi:AraC-like DNA-binding protein
MLRTKSYSLILMFSIFSVLLLLILLVVNGYKSFSYNRLSQESLSIVAAWNNLERTKTDLLMNRTNLNLQGEYDYRENVGKWERQTEDFKNLFDSFLGHVSIVIMYDSSLSYLKDASIIWDMTYTNLRRTNEILRQLEKTGLDSLLFPELVTNYYMHRMGDRISFQDSVLVMNLLNQFAFLDISSKEFSQQIHSFISELQRKHESNSRSLIVLSAIMLVLLIVSVVLTFLLFTKFRLADGHLAAYQREEHYKALRRFIRGHEEWEKIASRLDPGVIRPAMDTPAIPVFIRVDEYSNALETIGPTEINQRLSSLSTDLALHLNGQSFASLVIPFEEGVFVLHILRGTLLSENEEERAFKLIDAIKVSLKGDGVLRFSYTYGQIHLFPAETQKSFQELYEASFYKLLFGKDTIISAESVVSRSTAIVKYPIEQEKLLTECIKQGKIEKAKETYSAMMDVLAAANYVAIKNGINRMVVAITSALDSLEKFNNLRNSIDVVEVTRRIHAMETIKEINQTIYDLIDQIAAELSEKRDNHQYRQIGEIHAIIDREYANPNLSVNTIAERLNLSAAYVGRTYRGLTGMSIQERINRKRMETARELLLKEKITVVEICDTVGITNYMYFYTQFRKHFGTTPKEYRQKETGRSLVSPFTSS